MKPEEITVEDIEIATNTPAHEWEGNCYGTAYAVVETDLVRGRAVYGHFIGAVNENSFFGRRIHFPFIRHGWVGLSDGRIFDPTRWCFEGDSPYLWLGENDGSYDEGGNKFRRATMRPWPVEDKAENTYLFQLGPEVTQDLEEMGAKLLTEDRDPLDYDLVKLRLTANQVCWLANFPIPCFSSKQHAVDVFTQIVEHSLVGLIPVDNIRSILGDV